jgi:WD40 repeat protein
VAFSPDGKRFANGIAGYRFGQARVWDAETGEPVGPPVGHDDADRAVAFLPDGTGLVTASEDRTVRLWEVETGESVRVFPHED